MPRRSCTCGCLSVPRRPGWPRAAVVQALSMSGNRQVLPNKCFSDPSQARGRHNARMDSHERDFIVIGDKVALGPLRRDLAADYARWMNDPEVRCGLNQMGIATPQSQEKWVEENLERGAK